MPKKDSKDAVLSNLPEQKLEDIPVVLRQFSIAKTTPVASLEALRHVFRRPSSPLCEY